MTNTGSTQEPRPPVVVIMGHVDHGKSTLLDTIQKTNVVAGEAGGITQHISAYEATVQSEGGPRRITFIDTPGHAAFTGMRSRGASIADIAILIISAEDSIKEQTKEAISIIKENNVPFVVAINKIDRPAANVEKVKSDLLEQGVYVEGYGGDVPWAAISAKTGEGIDDLLETILLLADLNEFTGNPTIPATGFVVESHVDPKRGNTATLVIKNGSIGKGEFIATGDTYSSTRLLEDFAGSSLETARFSSPIRITGFKSLPEVGASFTGVSTKQEAEELCATFTASKKSLPSITVAEGQVAFPLIIKADVAGTLEAIEHEIKNINVSDVVIKIVRMGSGSINENDIRHAQSDPNTVILGFNVPIDREAQHLPEFENTPIHTYTIIYEMIDWLREEAERRRPRKEVENILGKAKLLKRFGKAKGAFTVGGRVTEGTLRTGGRIRIIRGNEEVTRGKIISIQVGKSPADHVDTDNEFGAMIELKDEPMENDWIEQVETVTV